MPHSPRFSPGRRGIRPRRARRFGSPEHLEDRNLLSATIYTVDSVTDVGKGSGTTGDLRYVIDQANVDPNPDGSLIQFNPARFATPRTITLSSPLDLSEAAGPEVIVGPGANLVTISGNHAVEVFSVAGGVTAAFEGLTIAHGSAGLGGGILNNGGTLTVSDSTLAGNSGALGGGIFNNGGTLTISNSTLANDSGAVGGGILNNGGTLTISDSTLASDSAYYSGGGIDNRGELNISGSTLAGDSADDGGAIDNERGKLTIVDSTLASNSAVDGGAIDQSGGFLTAVNDTFAYNFVDGGGSGGGIYIHGGMATLDNTIVALNTKLFIGGNAPDDISLFGGSLSSSSADNLIGNGGSGGLVNTIENQVGIVNPSLGALAYYGGPTQTIALRPGSPAIGAGSDDMAVDPTTGQPLEYDQRGAGFDRFTDGAVDIGAFEYLPAASDQVSVTWGPVGTAPLHTAADGLRLLPQGRTTDLPWRGIQQLGITLGQSQVLTPADVTVSSAIGVDYGPVTISGSGTYYTITLAQPIDAADRVTITIVNPGVSIFNRQIDVLPGDVDDDGVVSNHDVAGFRGQWLHGDRKDSLSYDIYGDGALNVQDYELIRNSVGTRLPAAGATVTAAPTQSNPGSGTGTVSVRVSATSGPAPSGPTVNRTVVAAGPFPTGPAQASGGRGWSLGMPSKTATIGLAGPDGL